MTDPGPEHFAALVRAYADHLPWRTRAQLWLLDHAVGPIGRFLYVHGYQDAAMTLVKRAAAMIR